MKRIIKFIVAYAPNYRQRHGNVYIPSLVSNEVTRPCTCGTDSALLNEAGPKQRQQRSMYTFSVVWFHFLAGPIKAPREDTNLTAQMHGQI